MILTETLTTEPIEINGFYGLHSYARKTEGRPTGGVSCYLRTNAGNFKVRHKEEDVLVVKTDLCTIIALYIRPQAETEEVIETVMTAISKTEEYEKIILAGDINCRIDKENIKTEVVIAALREEGYRLANQKDIRRTQWIKCDRPTTVQRGKYKSNRTKGTMEF